MRPFWPDDEAARLMMRWLATKLPGFERGKGGARIMGIADGDGAFVAMVLFSDWCPERETIEMTVASESPRWLSRAVIREALGYAFDTCRCQLVRVEYPLDRRSRGLCTKFGASEVIIPRLFGRHADGAIATLTDDQWATHPMNHR